jgi:hypothetical protein
VLPRYPMDYPLSVSVSEQAVSWIEDDGTLDRIHADVGRVATIPRVRLCPANSLDSRCQ